MNRERTRARHVFGLRAEGEKEGGGHVVCILAIFCFSLINIYRRGARFLPVTLDCVPSYAGSCLENQVPGTRMWFFIHIYKALEEPEVLSRQWQAPGRGPSPQRANLHDYC